MSDVDRREFAAAIREQAFQPGSEDHPDFGRYPGGIVHSLLGGLGADWSADDLVSTLDRARTVEWIPAPVSGHQLRVVVERDGRLLDYRFDVKKPGAASPLAAPDEDLASAALRPFFVELYEIAYDDAAKSKDDAVDAVLAKALTALREVRRG